MSASLLHKPPCHSRLPARGLTVNPKTMIMPVCIQHHQVTMKVAAAKVEAARTPRGPPNLVANACVYDCWLLLLSAVHEVNDAVGTGRYCNDLVDVRIVRGAAAAVKQRSLQIRAACILNNTCCLRFTGCARTVVRKQRRSCKLDTVVKAPVVKATS